ncbi:MAG TPA: hypothetical protein GX522_02450 [Firmicutes bacterium]|nr:hypothetical protein [Bacillota bacterium]
MCFISDVFNPVSDREVRKIIEWRLMLNTRPIGEWYSERRGDLQAKEISGQSSREDTVKKMQELQYQYYRKKLEIYLDTCFEVRTRFLKPLIDEKYDINYITRMWNWVNEKECRELAIEDSCSMIRAMKMETNTNIKLRKAQQYKVNIFTLLTSILSGIGGALIAQLWLK